MDMLRWVLLAIGVVAVVSLFLYSRYRRAGGNPTPWKRGVRNSLGDEIHLDDEALDGIAQEGRSEPGFAATELDVTDDAFSIESVQHSAARHVPEVSGEQMSLDGLESEEVIKTSANQKGASNTATGKRRKQGKDEPALQSNTQEKIIVLYLTALKNRQYSGEQVMHAMKALGFQYGDKQIFHYFSAENSSESVFGVANILEPGWFDLNAMHAFTTPGLVLFLQLPGPVGDLQAFELLIEKAQQLQGLLGGELKDDSRHPLNGQMINHMRDQVQGFSRQRKMSFT